MIEGGCLCGAVRYRVLGPPSVSMICHCASCARAAGSPAVAWVTFATDRFSVVRGTPAEYHSSPPVTRTFCGACGTPLTYRHADRPTDIDVTTRTLDEPSSFPPTHHAWMEDAPSWDRPSADLPAHPRGKPD